MSIEASRDRRDYPKYLRYIRKMGDVCLATEVLDQRIRLTRKQIGRKYASAEEINARLEPAVKSARKILDTTDPMNSNIRMGDYFRLLAHTSMASEMTMAPSVFASDDIDARVKLVDGVTGIATHIVEHAFELYDQTDDRRVAGQASGIINEFSAISLVNLEEDGTQIMLPSSQYADMFDKIDANYYGIYDDQKLKSTSKRDQYFRTSVQVKSSYQPPNTTSTPQGTGRSNNVAYIFANDFGNQRKGGNAFPVSTLLINEMNGIELFEYQHVILAEQSQNIENRIRSQRTTSNTKIL